MNTNPWFRPWGWTFRPERWQGWVLCLGFMTFVVHIFMVVDRQSHSITDTLYGIFPYVVPAFLLAQWVAAANARSQ